MIENELEEKNELEHYSESRARTELKEEKKRLKLFRES